MVALCNCAVVLFILCVSSFVSFYFCTSYPLLFLCTFVLVYFVCDIQSSPTDIFHLNESFRLQLCRFVLFPNFWITLVFFTLYNTMNDNYNCIVLI